MNYQIITDKDALLAFIEWLPELEPNETFYLCLFARSKYCKGIAHIKSDKAQLKRFTSNKSRMYEKIWQLESPLGSYTTKGVGTTIPVTVPQESLALYITINPRCFIKATRNGLNKLLDLALQPYNGFHPYQEVMSEVQKAKSKTRFISFDFDVDKNDWPEIQKDILDVFGNDFLTFVETRGGYHVIATVANIPKGIEKTWYLVMRGLLAKYSDDHDNAGDIMLPVPGVYQGGFTPKFIVP